MAQEPTGKPRSKGPNSALAVYRRREYVAQLLIERPDRSYVILMTRTKFPDISASTIDSDMRFVKGEWRARALADSKDVVADQLAAAYEEQRYYKKHKAHAAMTANRRLIVDILGAKAPERLQVTAGPCESCKAREEGQEAFLGRLEAAGCLAEYERLVAIGEGREYIKQITDGSENDLPSTIEGSEDVKHNPT